MVSFACFDDSAIPLNILETVSSRFPADLFLFFQQTSCIAPSVFIDQPPILCAVITVPTLL